MTACCLGRLYAKPFVCDVRRTLLRMTRLTQPAFGKRTQKPRPPSAPGATEDPWRIDWRILALVTIVFVVAFVWLF